MCVCVTHRNEVETPGQSREGRSPGFPTGAGDEVQGGVSACPAPALLRACPFYFSTAHLENTPKNMGDILRHVIDFAFETWSFISVPM